jgi:hypothetical protein
MIADFIRLVRVVAIAGVLICFRPVPVAQAQVVGGEQGTGGVEVTTRFSESQSLVPTQGRATPLRVELKEFHFGGHDVAIEVPDQGFYIAFLAWGNVRTQIGDTSGVHTAGAFWTVEKGTRMSVTVVRPGEGALIQTFSVNPER